MLHGDKKKCLTRSSVAEEMVAMDTQCPICVKKGLRSRLQEFQINMHEAITLCGLKECPYPAGSGHPLTDFLVTRSLAQMTGKSGSHDLRTKASPSLGIQPRVIKTKTPESLVPGHSSLQTPGHSSLQTPGHSSLQTPGQGAPQPQHCPTEQINTSLGLWADSSSQVTPVSNGDNRLFAHSGNAIQPGYDKSIDSAQTLLTSKGLNSCPNKVLCKGKTHAHDVYENNWLGKGCQRGTSAEELLVSNIQNPLITPQPPGQPHTILADNHEKSGYKDPCSKNDILSTQPKSELSPSVQNVVSNPVNNHHSTPQPLTTSLSEPCYKTTFLQWHNRDALCWLDVSMHLILHSYWFSRLLSTRTFNKKLVLPKLFHAYKSAQASCRQALQFSHYATLAKDGRLVTLQTSIGKIIVKTGGGGSVMKSALSPIIKDQGSEVVGSKEWVMTPTELNERATSLLNKARKTLAAARDTLWANLEPRLRCVLGKNDSPVFALPLMLKEHRLFQDYLKMKYFWQMDCTQCGYQHIDEQEKVLPSFPAVPPDFCMQRPHFLRACFQCDAPSQRMNMRFQILPDVIFAHFVDGLRGNQPGDYDFCHQGSWYAVSGVVQYTNQPDHFVAWLRDTETNHWMECDDLADEICEFSDKPPSFPLNQVHILMWEKTEGARVYTPSAGCEKLRRLCEAYRQPDRKTHTTQLKGSGSSAGLTQAPGFKKRGPGLQASDAIELSSQSSSDGQVESPDTIVPKILPGKASDISSPIVNIPCQMKEETVRGISLGGKDALLVPGLKQLQPKTKAEPTRSRTLNVGGALKKVGGPSSIAERVQQNLQKILAEKETGSVSFRPEPSEAGDSQADRLMRMRERLQMAKFRKGATANLTTAFVQRGQKLSDKLPAEVELDASKRQPPQNQMVSHLMPRAKQAKRESGEEIVEKRQNTKMKFSVLHSPSNQRSSVKEMLRALKSSRPTSPRPVSSQSFAGYRPKVKPEVTTNQVNKKGSQSRQGAQKNSASGQLKSKKAISFGQEVQVQTVPATEGSSKGGLKRRLVRPHDEQAKRILVPPKSSLSPRSHKVTSHQRNAETTIPQVFNDSEVSLDTRTRWSNNVISQSVDVTKTRVDLAGEGNTQRRVDLGVSNSGPLPHVPGSENLLSRQHRGAIPQLSPCSLRAGGTNSIISPVSSHLNSNTVTQEGGAIDDVIGQLCVALEGPVSTQEKPLGGHLKEHSALLDANLPSGINLDDSSEHMVPFDFDPSLFGDSPVKDPSMF